MRSLLLFLVVVAAFLGAAFGALQLMDSGDAPAAVAAQPSATKSQRAKRPLTPPPAKPTAAPVRRKSAAERSGDRWVNQAESICLQLESQVAALVQNQTPRTSSSALYRRMLGYERAAVARLHTLRRPSGRDGPLVDAFLSVLDRHVAVSYAALAAIEANDRNRIYPALNRLTAVSKAVQQAAADLGAFNCSGVGPLGS